MPDFTFAAGNRPTAAQWNSWVRDQGITICTSSTRPASPVTGRRIWESDTLDELIWSGSAWLVVRTGGAWDTWTPVVTQGATPTMTIAEAKFCRTERKITAEVCLQFTSAGTAANAIGCTLPVAGATHTAEKCVGSFSLLDSGAQWYNGSCVLTSATALRFRTNGGTDLLGINPAFTIANADTLTFTIQYEAAT